MEQIGLQVGERLKELRMLRQLTLDDAARLTGVSKPMLGQIERGQSSPTINTLWKIATGLKVPLSALCRQQDAEYTVAAPQDACAIRAEDDAMRAYPLFPFDPLRRVEMFRIEFDAGVRHASEAHAAGVEEYILMVRGELTLEIGPQAVCLSERQSIRFRADVPHAYHNASGAPCTVYNVIFYPDH